MPTAPRRPSSQPTDAGRALVEFVFLAILVLLPLFYLLLTAARLQAGAFAVSLASREAGRAYVTALSDEAGSARAGTAASLAFGDFGFDGAESGVTIACDGEPCLRAEGRVTATASVSVALPLIPDFISAHLPTSVTLSSTTVSSVDRFVAR